jgi:cell division septation protein DedD
MTTNRAGIQPSTLALLAVLAANVVLLVAQIWPDAGSVRIDDDEAAPPAAAALGQVASSYRVAPVAAPAVVKRVAMRSSAPICRAWGPFASAEEAETVATRLALEVDNFEIFASEVAAEADYLVTVRAAGNRAAAERVVRELRSQNIDSYVLQRGDATNVLAVGVFSQRDRADAQQRRVTTLGYLASVEPLDRNHTAYHLLARIPADMAPKIASSGSCNDIAPVQQFL